MDDLINRQAAIEVIDAVFPVDPMKSEYAQGIACGAALAKTYVEQQPSAQQWIPCSERLPDSQENVLCDDDGRVTIGYYIDEEIGWHDMHSYRIYPTAWMPLPDCYQGDGKGEGD